jgi:hypothetical protein
VREAARRLQHEMEHLQGDIIVELGGQKERTLYRQADEVLSEIVRFRGSVEEDAPREKLYRDFERMDRKLHDFLRAIDSLPEGQRALRRAAGRVEAADSYLHATLSAGDRSADRTRQLIEWQARALVAVTRELEVTARYAVGDGAERRALIDSIHELADAAEHFQKSLAREVDPGHLKRDFGAVTRAWGRTVDAMRLVPPRDNLYLLRSAQRVDEHLERLSRALGLDGDLPRITIRT